MSASVTYRAREAAERGEPVRARLRTNFQTNLRRSAWLLLLTAAVLLVDGFHPFAGDAGIYVAAVRHALDPSLYPVNALFVTAFSRYSIFAWAMAEAVRLTHLPLEWALLAAHVLSIFLFLAASRAVAVRLFTEERARGCAVVLAAACFTLPVAGTALPLMDPYVTARSFSTPLCLLAVAACLDGTWLRTMAWLALAMMVHPLMGAYAVAFVTLCAAVRAGRTRLAIGLCAVGIAACGAAFAWAHGMPVSPGYREAVELAPRSFLFLSRWRWYDVLGLAMPLLLFGIAVWKLRIASRQRAVCVACVLMGSSSVVVAAFLVPATGAYLLVPLQVLRSFHLIYALGVILCGGVLAALMKRSRIAGFALPALVFAGMFAAQEAAWPGCRHVEWPGARPTNGYERAFLWVRGNTPQDAVFAFDPRLDYLPDEDEQGFRAIAERDQLADDKDAGVVAEVPALAERWAAQRNAELHVDKRTDAERVKALAPLRAAWLLLPPDAATEFPCPYRNRVVMVCRMSR